VARKRVLDRLLRLRELEEELSRVDLEVAVGERNRIERELAVVVELQAQDRANFAASIGKRDTSGRTGAAMAMEQARKQRTRITPRLEAAQREVLRRQEEMLVRRTSRQQVKTLVEREQLALREVTGRRVQQMLDDWYGRRFSSQGESLRSHANAEPDPADGGAKAKPPSKPVEP
jgi:flagellar export protein FliJ